MQEKKRGDESFWLLGHLMDCGTDPPYLEIARSLPRGCDTTVPSVLLFQAVLLPGLGTRSDWSTGFAMSY